MHYCFEVLARILPCDGDWVTGTDYMSENGVVHQALFNDKSHVSDRLDNGGQYHRFQHAHMIAYEDTGQFGRADVLDSTDLRSYANGLK